MGTEDNTEYKMHDTTRELVKRSQEEEVLSPSNPSIPECIHDDYKSVYELRKEIIRLGLPTDRVVFYFDTDLKAVAKYNTEKLGKERVKMMFNKRIGSSLNNLRDFGVNGMSASTINEARTAINTCRVALGLPVEEDISSRLNLAVVKEDYTISEIDAILRDRSSSFKKIYAKLQQLSVVLALKKNNIEGFSPSILKDALHDIFRTYAVE